MSMPLQSGYFTTKRGGTNELVNTGGVQFVNTEDEARTVTVSNFDLTWSLPRRKKAGSVPQGTLVAEIDNEPGDRITLFTLGFGEASQTISGDAVQLEHIELVLTPTGEQTLSTALGTNLFSVGEICGSFTASFTVA
jgi:hypothetical protein